MILVTGGTGFLGAFVVKELIKRDYEFCCFVRESSDVDFLKENDIELRYGDLDEQETLEEALEGVDTLVNIASLGFGHAPNIIGACENQDIERGVFISTTAIYTTLDADSKSVRLEAEDIIKDSSLDYTIIRPTMIYGTEDDRNMIRLVKFLNKYPVIPVLGPGTYLLQPVYVKDLARAIVKTLGNENTLNNDYNIAGAKPLTYNEVVDTTAETLNTSIYKFHVPLKFSVWALSLYEKISPNPRLKAEQALRLNEDKDFSIEKAQKELNYSPKTFSEGIQKEVERARRLDLI